MAWGAYWLIFSRDANKTKESESPLSRLLHLAPIAVAFLGIFAKTFDVPFLKTRWLPEDSAAGPLGALITGLGLSFAVWARNHLGKYWSGIITLKEGHALIRTGPYRFARHPIYTGFLFGALGSAISLGKIRGLAAVALVLIAYRRKIVVEEGVLIKQFGEEYHRFRREVKALIPFVL